MMMELIQQMNIDRRRSDERQQQMEIDRRRSEERYQTEQRQVAEERHPDRTDERERVQRLLTAAQQRTETPCITPFTHMTKGDDIAIFLMGFETHMRNFQVNKQHWIKHLIPVVTQQVLEAYDRVAQVQEGDYDLDKIAILKQFNVTTET